jgi:hypothetical protein
MHSDVCSCPRQRKLISLNKRFAGRTNSECNLRHDQNSLLERDGVAPMTSRSDDRWPAADVLVVYLCDFAAPQKHHIRYNTTVSQITRLNEGEGGSDGTGGGYGGCIGSDGGFRITNVRL